MENTLASFKELLEIMDRLRAECPWDRKQTLESLRALTIEETYELSDAILANDLMEIKKELGDILLHIVFYAKIGKEKEAFDIKEVIDGICEKLIHRHPHIFGDVEVQDEEEVKQNWEKLKLKEGKKSVLEGVPNSLPALLKAYRMQEKAAGVGFDWSDKTRVWEKVKEEMMEFERELAGDEIEREKEFGDLIFSLINYARFLNINPEDALERTNKKFMHRFQYIEKKAGEKGMALDAMSLEEMEAYWQEAKLVKS